MRQALLKLTALCATLLAPLALHMPLAQAAPATSAAATTANARVIVKFKADSALVRRQALSAANPTAQRGGQADTLGQRLGLTLRAGAGVSDRSHVVFASGISSVQLAQRLAADADVEYAVPDERRRALAAPNDLYYPALAGTDPAVGQWYLRAPGGVVKSSINVEPAWDITLGSPQVVVAVLDTGVLFNHPDLKKVANGGNLLDGYDMINDVPTANDGNGRDADASDPGDWINQADINNGSAGPCTLTSDSTWHGTATAAVIGALTNNVEGMASVGRNVRVLPIRVLGKCGGFDSDIIAGMRWAAGLSTGDSISAPINTNPAQIVNLSLGGVGACSQAYVNAVQDLTALGVTVVASAGNGTGHAVSSPANCPGVIAVSGLRHVGSKVGYADVGPEITLSAPGGNCVNLSGACLYPILTASNTGFEGPLTTRLLQRNRHQLFGAAGGRHGGIDVVGRSDTHPAASEADSSGHGTPVSQLGRHQHQRLAGARMHRTPVRHGRQRRRPGPVLLQQRHLRRGHARCGCRGDKHQCRRHRQWIAGPH